MKKQLTKNALERSQITIDKNIILKVIIFLIFAITPSPLLGQTEFDKEKNKCRYALEVCYKDCLKKDVDAKTKPTSSKVEECLRECDFYDDLCNKIATRLYDSD